MNPTLQVPAGWRRLQSGEKCRPGDVIQWRYDNEDLIIDEFNDGQYTVGEKTWASHGTSWHVIRKIMNKTNIKLYATKEQAQIVHSLATLYKITTGEVQPGDQTIFWDWDWPFRPRVSFAFENARWYEHGNSGWRIFKADQFDAGLAAITEQLVGYRPVPAPLVIGPYEVQLSKNGDVQVGCTTVDSELFEKIAARRAGAMKKS